MNHDNCCNRQTEADIRASGLTWAIGRNGISTEYVEDRTAELGPFFGEIIAGIYDGIRLGAYNNTSDFEALTGRPHQSWDADFSALEPASGLVKNTFWTVTSKARP